MTGLGCILLLVSLTVSTILDGLALKTLWMWFVVPVFDVPQLTIAQAIGVGLVVALLIMTRVTNQSDKSFEEQAYDALGWAVAKPLFFIFIGFIVQLFM